MVVTLFHADELRQAGRPFHKADLTIGSLPDDPLLRDINRTANSAHYGSFCSTCAGISSHLSSEVVNEASNRIKTLFHWIERIIFTILFMITTYFCLRCEVT